MNWFCVFDVSDSARTERKTGYDCYTASLHQATRSIDYVSLFVTPWFAAIGAF